MFDLIVLGAGPGGYPAALEAAKLGKSVAIIEEKALGGTCLNCGCIPTKLLLHTTSLYQEMKESARFGIGCENPTIHYDQMWENKVETITSLRNGIGQQLKKGKVVVLQGRGKVVCAKTIEVEDKEGIKTAYEAEHILIATGSRPFVPPIKGADLPEVLTSDDILNDHKIQYDSITIIGGGVIGMEMATVFSNLGCKVTVLEGQDRILPTLDKEIAQNLKMILKKKQVTIVASALVKEIQKTETGVLCIYEEKGVAKEVSSAAVLVSVGRKPNSQGIFAEEIKETLQFERDFLQVDETFRTSIPSIYAIGDVIGGIQLAHVATAEGLSAISHMFGTQKGQNLAVVPSCVYTEPEIACVGMSLEEAKAQGIEAEVGKYIMSTNGKSMLTKQERGFIKIVARKDNHQIIGAQMMCARATDMIGEISLAIAKQLTAKDVAEVIHAHPTFAEGIGEAVEGIL